MSFLRYWKEPVPTILGTSLRTGTLWIAEITLLSGTCFCLYSFMSLLKFDTEADGRDPIYGARFLFIIPLILGLITAIVGGLLFYGVIMQKPALLLPWIIYASIMTCLVLLTALGGGFWLACIPAYIGAMWLTVVSYGILTCAVMRYCIVGVHSFYRQLKIGPPDSSSQVVILT